MKIKINKLYRLINEIGLFETISLLYLKMFNKKKYDLKILEKIKNENLKILKYYSEQENKISDVIHNTDYIWFFWWQGEESMPSIIKKCYESIKKHSGKHEIIFLSRDNFNNYADFPDYVLNKFLNGKYSITHFSDILRMNLLSKKGGIWIDATIYLTDDLTVEIDKGYSIFTRKSKNKTKYISNGMWSSYFIATSKNNLLSTACYDILCNYWKNHDFMIEYLLLDYIIFLLYTEIGDINKQINYIPYNNEGIHNLECVLGNDFSIEEYDDICEASYIHKLNWKNKYPIQNKNKKLTYYGYILSGCEEERQ